MRLARRAAGARHVARGRRLQPPPRIPCHNRIRTRLQRSRERPSHPWKQWPAWKSQRENTARPGTAWTRPSQLPKPPERPGRTSAARSVSAGSRLSAVGRQDVNTDAGSGQVQGRWPTALTRPWVGYCPVDDPVQHSPLARVNLQPTARFTTRSGEVHDPVQKALVTRSRKPW